MRLAHKFPQRASSRRLRHREVALLAAVTFVGALLMAGCGGEEGVAEDAAVTVYVAAPLCAGAEAELERQGDPPDSARIQVACLPEVQAKGGIDLAQIGANARRATQDSTTIAYIGEADPAATRFSATILEAADIPQLPDLSGQAAMSKLLTTIEEAPSGGSLRESVNEELQ